MPATIIRRAVGADRDEYAVIFCGSGTTGAVDKLVAILNLRIPADLDRRYDLRSRIPAAERPVVFIGPYEHHSNELPWRESIADVVTIREDADGHIDLAHLADELERYADRPLRIGSFSAASNVTGILSDTRAISVLLHRHGALVVLGLRGRGAVRRHRDVAPPSRRWRRTASRHGGRRARHEGRGLHLAPQAHRRARARRDCSSCDATCSPNSVPAVVGGGTVAYVNPFEHVYLADPEQREEGGTPAIIESIRAGLVFGLKEAVGAEADPRARGVVHRAGARGLVGRAEPRDPRRPPRAAPLDRLASSSATARATSTTTSSWRCSTTSSASSRAAAARARDRTATACSASTSRPRTPSSARSSRGCEGIKPGWVRVNFNYFISETVFAHISRRGRARRPAKAGGCCRSTASTRRPACGATPPGSPTPPLSLHDVRFTPDGLEHPGHRLHEPESRLADYLAEARALLADPPAPPAPPQGLADLAVGEHFGDLRWFLMPDEAAGSSRRSHSESHRPRRHDRNVR